jgi:predicted 3-demethylubiquinone-9 3-methyltransferase (glyoxalase superfamily)
MTAAFEIEGQKFMAINGGPKFKFNEAVSFFIRCDTQAENAGPITGNPDEEMQR